MFCIYCGGTLPDGAAFCPSCGKKVSNYSSAVHTQTAKSIFRPGVCPACGSNQLKVLGPGVYLCEHCGTKSYAEGPAALEDDAPLDVRVAVLLKEAEEYSANKDLKNELLSLSKALSLAPENYSVLFYLGRCYSRLDLYDKALCCATDLQGKGVVRNDGVLFLCKKAIGPHQVLHSRKQLPLLA